MLNTLLSKFKIKRFSLPRSRHTLQKQTARNNFTNLNSNSISKVEREGKRVGQTTDLTKRQYDLRSVVPAKQHSEADLNGPLPLRRFLGADVTAGQYGEEPRSDAKNVVSVEANVSKANVKQSGRNYKVIRMKGDWNKQLPFYLDTLALCLDAGMSLHNALKFVVSKAPISSLHQSFLQIVTDIRAGQSWHAAWKSFAEKTPTPEMQQLAQLLIQAEQLGLSLAPIFRSQAEHVRLLYFSQIEKQALETPVKMLFPLILFIFPCSFIVLAFPIAHQLFKLIHQI